MNTRPETSAAIAESMRCVMTRAYVLPNRLLQLEIGLPVQMPTGEFLVAWRVGADTRARAAFQDDAILATLTAVALARVELEHMLGDSREQAAAEWGPDLGLAVPTLLRPTVDPEGV